MMKIEAKGPIVNDNSAWFYDWLGWKCVSPGKITKALEEAAGDDVIVEINSTGGIVMAGYEMYKSLMDYTGKVTAHVIVACSAATFLACAADDTRISDGGIFMIHNVQSYAEGDYRDMQMEADALKQFNEGIINIYERKTGRSREELQRLMDNDTYMSPALAVEYGFVDGYIYERQGTPKEQPQTNAAEFVQSIAASAIPAISEDKIKELATIMKEPHMDGEVAPVQRTGEAQNIGVDAVSDKSKNEGGENKMTLEEFLAENAGEQAKINEKINAARNEGAAGERERLKSLDAIAATVPAAMLEEAKYGAKPIDGPALAYQAMVKGEKAAMAYMGDVMKDAEDSGTKDVGVGNPDAGEQTRDESDDLAGYINEKKGAR